MEWTQISDLDMDLECGHWLVIGHRIEPYTEYHNSVGKLLLELVVIICSKVYIVCWDTYICTAHLLKFVSCGSYNKTEENVYKKCWGDSNILLLLTNIK